MDNKHGRKRWDAMVSDPQLGEIVTRFDAINGYKHDFRDDIRTGVVTERISLWNTKFSKGELGCLMSHYMLWKKIVDESIPVTLILEDDAEPRRDDCLATISKMMEYLPTDWDIFLIGFQFENDNSTWVNEHISKVTSRFIDMHSYVLTLEGAKRLVAAAPIHLPVDLWVASLASRMHIYRHRITEPSSGGKIRGSVMTQSLRWESSIRHTTGWTSVINADDPWMVCMYIVILVLLMLAIGQIIVMTSPSLTSEDGDANTSVSVLVVRQPNTQFM